MYVYMNIFVTRGFLVFIRDLERIFDFWRLRIIEVEEVVMKFWVFGNDSDLGFFLRFIFIFI